MSGWQMLGVLVGCVVVAWCWLKIWEILAGPLEKPEDDATSKVGWWYFDGQDWHR